MKILIVSDTHRNDDNLQKVIKDTSPLDMLIHLGDSEGSELKISQWAGENCKTYVVKGNNDFFSNLDLEKEIRIGKKRVLITHGHLYNVSLGVEILRQEAIARGYDIAMFGHTHKPYYETDHGIVILNPGSLSFPRQADRKPTYAIMETGKGRDMKFTLNSL